MNTIIFDDKNYNWTHKRLNTNDIYLKGGLWIANNYYTDKLACSKVNDIFQSYNLFESEEIQSILDNITGHFAFIISNKNYTLAVVDKIRSIPIYYYQYSDCLHVSNSAIRIHDNFNLKSFNNDAILQFKMAGYTLGKYTLYDGLYQLSVGEYLYSENKESTYITKNYFKYFVDQTSNNTEEELIEELHIQTLKTFNKMIESLNGLPVFLPLSGGYDSRFILSILKEMKYDNIISYTYGIKGLWEVKRAKYIADKLDTPWIFLEFNPKRTRRKYYTKDRKDYYSYAAGYNSAPHLAEYYALLKLRNEKLIPENAIIINGQSGDFTSGGHLPKILLSQKDERLSIDNLISTIIDKHFSLWSNEHTEENLYQISKSLKKIHHLDNIQYLSKEDFAKYYEYLECHERQSKFVVNGQRAYEWLGHDWRLPFWSDELMIYWRNVPWNIKFGQRLLLKYFSKYNFGGALNEIQLPPQYSYYPLYVKLAKPFFSLAKKISGNNIDFQQKYFKYFMSNAPYYTQLSYKEYVKDSQWHRNPVSYWSQYMLSEILGKDNKRSARK